MNVMSDYKCQDQGNSVEKYPLIVGIYLRLP